MSKIIDNRLLERIGSPKKLVEQALEDQIRVAGAGLEENESELISKILMLFIPKEGVNLQLNESEIGTKLPEIQTKIQNVLQQLNKVGILTSYENGQYEIASAVLASHIYERIEADNRVLRKVETFIHDRFATYKETGYLLNQDDLNYINPYLSAITISNEEVDFIGKARTKLTIRRRYLIMAVIVIVSVLAALTISAYLQSQEAQKQKEIAENVSLDLKDANAELEKARQIEFEKNKQLAEQNVELDKEKQNVEKEAEDNKKLAAENIRLAKAEADKNAQIAELAKQSEQRAKRARLSAELEAEEKQKLAKKAQEEADKNAKLAKQNADLNAIILSRNVAKQATQLDDKETDLKALLAKEAFQINADSEEYGNVNHPDIYSALYDGLKSLNKQGNAEDFNQLSNDRGSIRSIVLNENGDFFYTVGSYGALKKWEVKKWNAIDKPEVNQSTLDQLSEVQNAMKISADNQWLVVGGKTQNIRLYNLKTPNSPPHELNLHNGAEVFDIVFIPDNSGFVSSGADQSLQFYNIKENSVKKIANTQSRVETITITPHKPYLLYYGTVEGKLFEQPVDGLPLQLEPNANREPYQRITAIAAYQYDQKKVLAIGYVNGLVKIFQADFGRFQVDRGGTLMFHSSKVHSARIAELKFNNTKQQLGVASYDGTASLWDLTEQDLRHYQPILLNDGTSWVMSLAFSKSNGQILIGNRDGEILFFNPDPSVYANEICNKVNRSLKRDEWDQFIGKAIKYRKTCP